MPDEENQIQEPNEQGNHLDFTGQERRHSETSGNIISHAELMQRLGSDQDYVNPYDQSSGSGVESDTDPAQDQEEYRRTSGRKSYPSNLGPGTSSKLESYTSQEAVDGSRTTSYQHNSRGGGKDVHHRQRERGRSTKTPAPLKDNKAEHRNSIDPTKASEGSQDTVQPSDASPERKDRGRARSRMISG